MDNALRTRDVATWVGALTVAVVLAGCNTFADPDPPRFGAADSGDSNVSDVSNVSNVTTADTGADTGPVNNRDDAGTPPPDAGEELSWLPSGSSSPPEIDMSVDYELCAGPSSFLDNPALQANIGLDLVISGSGESLFIASALDIDGSLVVRSFDDQSPTGALVTTASGWRTGAATVATASYADQFFAAGIRADTGDVELVQCSFWRTASCRVTSTNRSAEAVALGVVLGEMRLYTFESDQNELVLFESRIDLVGFSLTDPRILTSSFADPDPGLYLDFSYFDALNPVLITLVPSSTDDPRYRVIRSDATNVETGWTVDEPLVAASPIDTGRPRAGGVNAGREVWTTLTDDVGNTQSVELFERNQGAWTSTGGPLENLKAIDFAPIEAGHLQAIADTTRLTVEWETSGGSNRTIYTSDFIEDPVQIESDLRIAASVGRVGLLYKTTSAGVNAAFLCPISAP